MQNFQKTGKAETLYLYLKKGDKKTSKTIIQSLFFKFCSKFFERIICDNMLKYFLDNNLTSLKQLGFIKQSRAFLNISKAFYKVWHDGLT